MKNGAKLIRACVKRANARRAGFWDRWDLFWNAPAGGFSEAMDRVFGPLLAVTACAMLALVVIGILGNLAYALLSLAMEGGH